MRDKKVSAWLQEGLEEDELRGTDPKKEKKKKKYVLRWWAITLRLTSSIRYGMKMTTLGCHMCARPWKPTSKGFTVLRDSPPLSSSSFILVALRRSSFFFWLSAVFTWPRGEGRLSLPFLTSTDIGGQRVQHSHSAQRHCAEECAFVRPLLTNVHYLCLPQ